MLKSYECPNIEYNDWCFCDSNQFTFNISGLKVLCYCCDSGNNRHENKTKDNNQEKKRFNFNEQISVPETLCSYIGISSDEKKSRPQVTVLLNSKFNEYGLMKTKKDDNDKEIKVIILDKTTANKLKRKEGHEIFCRDIQQFISEFYKEASMGEFSFQ